MENIISKPAELNNCSGTDEAWLHLDRYVGLHYHQIWLTATLHELHDIFTLMCGIMKETLH
jgi:hypothetical protein